MTDGLVVVREPPPTRVVRATDLTAQHLGRRVTVTDWEGVQTTGRLYRLEFHIDSRVAVSIATEEPTESGGSYLSYFGRERMLDSDSLVRVGEVWPDGMDD